MPLSEIIALLTSLATTLGPLVVRLFTTWQSGGDVGAVLAAERVEAILPATSRLELAEQAARLRAARDAGHVAQLAPAERLLVDVVLASHAALALAEAA